MSSPIRSAAGPGCRADARGSYFAQTGEPGRQIRGESERSEPPGRVSGSLSQPGGMASAGVSRTSGVEGHGFATPAQLFPRLLFWFDKGSLISPRLPTLLDGRRGGQMGLVPLQQSTEDVFYIQNLERLLCTRDVQLL